KLHANVRVALVFVWQEAGWDLVGEEAAGGGEDDEHHNRYRGFFDDYGAPGDIAIRGALEEAVEPIEEPLEKAVAFFSWFQQQRSEGGAEGQGVKRGQQHGNSDGNRKLLVEFAGNAGNEGSRHEDGGENERNPDDGAGEFFHGSQGRVLGS